MAGDDALDELRRAGDPPADALVRGLGDRFPRALHAVLQELVENDAPPPEHLPPALRAFLKETAALPPWADPARIAAGQRLFSRYGPQCVLALLCAALPECYAAAPGAQILGLSNRLRRYTHRRVLETAQLVLDVMAPGGLGAGGRGVRTTQKVRLVHALHRPLLARHRDYDPAWGVPINQEDMLGTLMAFSVVVLDSLPRLGIDVSPEEEDGYLHAWLVVGYLLGVDGAHFPDDVRGARAFADGIRRRHHAPSPAGRALAAALVRLLEQAMPGTALDGFVCVLIRHLCGDRVADILGLPREDWTRALLWPLRQANRLLDAVCDSAPPISRATEIFSRKLLEGAYVAEQGTEPVQLYVPPHMAQRWSLVLTPRPAAAARSVPSDRPLGG